MVSIDDLAEGTIIDIRDPYSFDDKHKYSIIVAHSADEFMVATVFINSEINTTTINSPELVALQHEILPTSYRFLRQKSFVDCSIITDRTKIALVNEINETGRVLGNLSADDLLTVRTLITNAESIYPYYKKLFCLIE
jgi:hypothetical protein